MKNSHSRPPLSLHRRPKILNGNQAGRGGLRLTRVRGVPLASKAWMRPRTGGRGQRSAIDTSDGTHEAERVGCISVTLRMSVPHGGRFNGAVSEVRVWIHPLHRSSARPSRRA